jgi:hypothetical protein
LLDETESEYKKKLKEKEGMIRNLKGERDSLFDEIKKNTTSSFIGVGHGNGSPGKA